MTQLRVAVIGCGIVGALVAYELSRDDRFQVTLFDRQQPGQGSTGAALGVLMGVISHKTKGRRWQRCWAGLERYERLVPELAAIAPIPFNQAGLLRLCFEGEAMAGWERLAELRASQGLPLELLDLAALGDRFPQVQGHLVQGHGPGPQLIGAVYSPRDRQLQPLPLVQALVQAAQLNGVDCHFNTEITQFVSGAGAGTARHGQGLHCQSLAWVSRDPSLSCNPPSPSQALEIDQIVITAGLGSPAIAQLLSQQLDLAPASAAVTAAGPGLDLRPVLGQALQIALPEPLAPGPQPVITGQDIHIVPLFRAGGAIATGTPAQTPAPTSASTSAQTAALTAQAQHEYWIGATVELPDGAGNPPAIEAQPLDDLLKTAQGFCPALAQATVLRQWSGLRPRPEGCPAPVLEPLAGYGNVLLATGHYRNGVLLAPASADWVKAALETKI